MTCGIYLIKHKSSGRAYVGQSVNIESRFRDHRAGKGSVKLSAALNKYGAEGFEFKVLLECPRDALGLAREAGWWTEERKAQQSRLMASLSNSPEWKVRSSERSKALAKDPEVNAKRSAALKRYHQQRREGVAA